MTKLKPKVDNELIHRGDHKLRIMSFFVFFYCIWLIFSKYSLIQNFLFRLKDYSIHLNVIREKSIFERFCSWQKGFNTERLIKKRLEKADMKNNLFERGNSIMRRDNRPFTVFRSSPPEVFLENVQQIYDGTAMLMCDYWNHTSAWVFSCKFNAYFQNTIV